MKRLLAGGIAGQISWLISMPQDVIKSHIQCNNEGRTIKIADAAKQLYRQHGARVFMKGFVPVMLRAFPSNAVNLTVYDYISEMLRPY